MSLFLLIGHSGDLVCGGKRTNGETGDRQLRQSQIKEWEVAGHRYNRALLLHGLFTHEHTVLGLLMWLPF